MAGAYLRRRVSSEPRRPIKATWPTFAIVELQRHWDTSGPGINGDQLQVERALSQRHKMTSGKEHK
jgi:hypothetical protein